MDKRIYGLFLLIILSLSLLNPLYAEDEFKPIKNSEEFENMDQDEFAPLTNNEAEETNKESYFLKVIKENNIIFLITAVFLGFIAFFFKLKRARFIILLASLAYLGFYIGGCNCSVGAFMKLAYSAIFERHLLLSLLLLIGIPIITTFLFGRIFCGYVCPIGALQEIINIRDRALKISNKVERKLRLIRFLLLAIVIIIPLIQKEFIFNKILPFKAVFNINGNLVQIILAATILLLSLFIYRPFCRFGCPFSLVLEFIGKYSLIKIKKDASFCGTCKNCLKKCPVNAISDNCKVDNGVCIRCGECCECIKE